MRAGRNLHIAVWLAMVTPLIPAAVSAQSPGDSFQEFRAGIMRDFANFRKGILEDYDKFLDGVWKDYNTFKGEDNFSRPKPADLPVSDGRDDNAMPPAVVDLPSPEIVPEETPAIQNEPAPQPAVTPEVPSGSYTFDFFGIDTKGPQPNLKLLNIRSQSDFAQQWRDLSKSSSASDLVKSLSAIAASYGLNDYLTYELVGAYVNSAYADVSQQARHALAHYILANMGYDVRLATIGGKAVLLLALDDKIYFRPGLELGGPRSTRYYVFELGNRDGSRLPTGSVSTCQLPNDADKGRKFSLILKPMSLPEKPQEFTLEGGGLKVKGTTNANLTAMLYRYPVMPMGNYAQSAILPDVRKEIVRQLREQLAETDKRAGVDRLLEFCQQITAYATDETNHGFEKPYFVEEMLVYPKSDCEDRAILYTYLLKNVLGLENQLIAYPNHESAAVCLDSEEAGDSYTYNGKRFYISDPCYIGAHTGMCMPAFRKTNPEIDYHYKP